MQTPRIIFFGNTAYSAIVEEKLHSRFSLAAAVTIPDRIGSRRAIVQSPVKTFAQQNGIPVILADKLSSDVIEKIKRLEPDFLIVDDYGLLLPAELLSLPHFPPLNVHHSLLPKYRGPSPAPTAIIRGEEETGVSIIVMNEKMDTGDIVSQVRYRMRPDETTDSLLKTLNTLGAEAVIEAIEAYLVGTAQPKKQNAQEASYTKQMTKLDGLIDLSDDPLANWRKFRAYGKWPGVFFKARHENSEIHVKVTKASLKEGAFSIERVVPAGRREMGYQDFLRGIKK